MLLFQTFNERHALDIRIDERAFDLEFRAADGMDFPRANRQRLDSSQCSPEPYPVFHVTAITVEQMADLIALVFLSP